MIVDRRSVEVQSVWRKAQRMEKEKGKSFRLFARLRRNKGVNEMERKNNEKENKRVFSKGWRIQFPNFISRRALFLLVVVVGSLWKKYLREWPWKQNARFSPWVWAARGRTTATTPHIYYVILALWPGLLPYGWIENLSVRGRDVCGPAAVSKSRYPTLSPVGHLHTLRGIKINTYLN